MTIFCKLEMFSIRRSRQNLNLLQRSSEIPADNLAGRRNRLIDEQGMSDDEEVPPPLEEINN